ncbi:YwmB family TATA-box binding protein [Calderihabitans maritimus]|uniref:Pyruvate carboxylase n=1 Tax=Calderihabitans maritimus TaxID=1246530 RepID=A0A1Z5HWY1_9FIRM|nr:YwmB family TATA-box binding protein [Calderihabitans maritimus]GAW93841.1 pyruvate carboxylase [Calderihabitans maritimus]
MKRLLLIFIFTGIVISSRLAPGITVAGKANLEDVVNNAFLTSGAETYELNVQGWAQINNKYLTSQELNDALRDICRVIGLDGAVPILTVERDFRGISAGGSPSQGISWQVSLQSLAGIPGTANPRDETYLIINGTQLHSVSRLLDMKEKIRKAFQLFGSSEPNLSVIITGTFPGKLSTEEKQAIIRRIFRTAGAVWVEGVVDGDFISVTGYTPLIKDYLLSGDKKVNLNIAFRYHNIDQKTYIYIGSPLLGGEY